MNRCLQLAANGIGTARPNPSVGAVVVCDHKIIGEGFTSSCGGNHAEVNAIQSVKNKELLKKSTIYVTLEPCSHFGKTPPCSDLIIRSEIKKVVIGTIDSHSLVAGKGVEKLRNAGCEVVVGVLEEECKEQHKRFFTFHNKKRPYVILKWAESLDGFIAPKFRDKMAPVWITSKESRQLVHQWRSQEHAILVGTNTVLEDNPSLTTREVGGKNPIRIILDKRLKISSEYSVLDKTTETIIFTEKVTKNSENLSFESIDFLKSIAGQICGKLYEKEIQSVIIEGGAKTLQIFIDGNFWDEARVFVGNNMFHEGVKAPVFFGEVIEEIQIKEDRLKMYKND